MPRCTFTHPEVATVGLTLSEALRQLGSQVSAKLRHLEEVDRAICEGGDLHGSEEFGTECEIFHGTSRNFGEIFWRDQWNYGIFPEA